MLSNKASYKQAFQTVLMVGPVLLAMGAATYIKNAPFETKSISYKLRNRSIETKVFQLARTATERKRGLQNVYNLSSAYGLILVYPEPRQAQIWMKDTPMPLHILFVDEAGYVRSTRFGTPNSEDVLSADLDVKYVVEIPASQIKQHVDFVGAKFLMN